VLIEVMVGAVVLSIASIAILNGLDGAQSAGAKNKARSIQSTLAQQDIERMRSLPLNVLDALNQTRQVNVAGVDYTVVSRTDWVSDSGGPVNCSDTRAQAEYLKLSSAVSSPATGATPVTETGLLTPTVGQLSDTSGTATVQLVNRSNVPIAGVGVSLTGASSQSATTNALGCAVFGYIPSGTYSVTVTGYVTMESDHPATSAMQVYPGRASFKPMQVDRPATLRANFAKPALQTFGTTVARASAITVKNANLPGAAKVFTGSLGASLDAGELYPFLDGVGVYAGSCAKNDPSGYPGQDAYFQTSGRGSVALSPGQALAAVTVEMPTLRVIVKRSNNGSFSRSRVIITPIVSDGCGSTAVYSFQDNTNTATHNHDAVAPFGTYQVCADDNSRFVVIPSVALTAAPALANKSIIATVPTFGSSGTCPQ
jgi:Tfp pilus assembly protein PilV